MLTYKPSQSNKTGLDPVNPALTVEEVQYQLAVYEFLSLPTAARKGEPAGWQHNRAELLKLRLMELNATPLIKPPAALVPAIDRAKRQPQEPPTLARVKPKPEPKPDPAPELDQWAELLKAVLAVGT